IVVMGEDALRFLNELEFPLADTLEEKVGELQRFTPTIEALLVPDIDASLDEQPAKTRFWNAFKQLGPWWAELPPYWDRRASRRSLPWSSRSASITASTRRFRTRRRGAMSRSSPS